MLVIMGKNASRAAKVLVEYSRQDAASAMLREALNGYSTVFSAALLKEDAIEIFEDHKHSSSLRFLKVEKRQGVVSYTSSNSAAKPRIQESRPSPAFEEARRRGTDGRLEQVGMWC